MMEERSKELLLRYEKSLDCIHCGLCLSSCPTYLETGNEAMSPRGRISLMRGLAEGELELDEVVSDPLDHCLLCQACESVCPSAVQFAHMMEITRHEMKRKNPAGFFERFLLRRVIPSRGWLGFVAALTRVYKNWGIRALVRGSGLIKLLPKTLRRMDDCIPDVPPSAERRALPGRILPQGEPRGRVALLEGCVMPELFGDVNRRTSEALVAQGFEVVVPAAQTCCGALHSHAGDRDTAHELARRNIRAFLDEDVDWIVLNAAGCGASMKEYGHWFADSPDKEEAEALAAKVIDIMELFHREGLLPRGGPTGGPVVYDAPCHLHHAQGCQTGGPAVLARVPGLELVPMNLSDQCCGAAGIYNIVQPDMSDAVLATKLDALEASGARVILTGNPGCMMQWRRGIEARGLDIEVRHPVDYL